MCKKYLDLSRTGKTCTQDFEQISNPLNLECMHQILMGRYVHLALEAMRQDGYLQEIIPGIDGVLQMRDKKGRFKDLWEHTKKVVQQSKSVLSIRWAAFFHDFGKPECFSIENGRVQFHNHERASVKYFKEFARKNKIFQREEYNEICFLIKNLGRVEAYNTSWTDSAVRRFHKDMGKYFDSILLLSRADVTTGNKEKRASIQKKISELKKRAKEIYEKDNLPTLPKGIGKAMIDIGYKAGKEIGEAKRELEHLVQEGQLEGNRNIDYYMMYLKAKRAFNDMDH